MCDPVTHRTNSQGTAAPTVSLPHDTSSRHYSSMAQYHAFYLVTFTRSFHHTVVHHIILHSNAYQAGKFFLFAMRCALLQKRWFVQRTEELTVNGSAPTLGSGLFIRSPSLSATLESSQCRRWKSHRHPFAGRSRSQRRRVQRVTAHGSRSSETRPCHDNRAYSRIGGDKKAMPE